MNVIQYIVWWVKSVPKTFRSCQKIFEWQRESLSSHNWSDFYSSDGCVFPGGTFQTESDGWMASPPQVLQMGPTSISCKALLFAEWYSAISNLSLAELNWVKASGYPKIPWDTRGRSFVPCIFVRWLRCLSTIHTTRCAVLVFLCICLTELIERHWGVLSSTYVFLEMHKGMPPKPRFTRSLM